MYDKILPLLGKSIESEEIKALFLEWNVMYPRKTFCLPDNPNIKGKVEKHCLRLHFGIIEPNLYAPPIPTTWAGGFIGQFTAIEFTKKRTDAIPFGIKFNMTPEELTAIMGAPVVADGTTTWRKDYSDKHELVITEGIVNNELTRTMKLTFMHEPDAATLPTP